MSGADARLVCTCTYDGISGSGGLTFDQFEQVSDRLEEEPGILPSEIRSIVDGCRSEAPR